MGPVLDARAGAVAVLQKIQNTDGGWGYHAARVSRVEPTCWAMLALKNSSAEASSLARAREFLLKNQAKEGFWSATPEMQTGNWVTSLACFVLSDAPEAGAAVTRGLEWLCSDFPLDSSWWVRQLRRLRRGPKIAEMSDVYRGWGWTPRTSSWVEPTAFALMALEHGASGGISGAAQRRELAVNLLYDRMCPGGGWNCGNPMVYGVAGQPLVLPTSWALLALRSLPEHEKKVQSLAWLRAEVPKIESPASLAAATICLAAYGEGVLGSKSELEALSPEQVLGDGVHVLAWRCLALDSEHHWPWRKGSAA